MAWDRPWDTEKLCSHAPRVALENLALRQQLAVWKARQPRPQLAATDRIFWVMLSVRTTCRSCAQVARARRVQVIGGGWGARCRASFFHRREGGSALGLQQHHDEPGRLRVACVAPHDVNIGRTLLGRLSCP